jgi:hypothetical protein
MFPSMSSTTEKTTFVFIIGDQTVSGSGYTNSVSIRRDAPLEIYTSYLRQRLQPSKWFDLDVSIRASEIIVSNGEFISKKLVGDCSIEELIFAITQKVNGKK